jgi:hypothetical protein
MEEALMSTKCGENTDGYWLVGTEMRVIYWIAPGWLRRF